MRVLHLLAAAFAVLLATLHGQQGLRQWTDLQGRRVEAAFAGLEGDSVLLRMGDGRTVPFPLARLSEADQAFVRAAGGGGAATAVAGPERVPIERRSWPGTVAVPTRSVEIRAVEENAAARRFVYQSEAFEFTAQAKLAGSVMTEVARTFEATRAVVDALPWGIVCRPPDGLPRFLAALYETREDYVAAGGPPLSGGVYNTAEKTFRIPFASLGLEKRGQTYFKSDFSSDTLVHEITHQMMHDYLAFLPKWVIEGTAEYVEMLPYRAGVFRADAHKTAMKEAIEQWGKRGFAPVIGNLEAHLTMGRDAWDASSSTAERMIEMYHRSHLLVYYFCHLDGDRTGSRFLRYMEAVHGEVAAMHAFFADPRVKRLDGGRFSYPRDLRPPPFGDEAVIQRHLALLVDGRSYSQLAEEIVAGYRSIGVRVQVR
jgi:hypothetical protein